MPVLDPGALQALLTSPTGPVGLDLLRRARLVENEAKRLCPVDHGRLRSSITHEVTTETGALVARVGTNVEYALFVHEGTGIYGPRGSRIYPVSARVLAWASRGGGMNFAASVAGVPPRPFLRNALPAAMR